MNWTRGLCGGGGLLFHSFQARYSRTDLPLNFHPAAIRASAVDTPFGAV